MAWSYDPTALESSPKDQIRLRLGDTDESDSLLQDEEILFMLKVAHDDVERAAIQCCSAIIALLTGAVDFKIGPYSESQGNRIKAFQLLYDQMVAEASALSAPVCMQPTTSSVFHYDMMTLEPKKHE